MKNYQYITLTKEGNRVDISLNRPEYHNAIIPEMIDELHHAFEFVENEEDVHFVVLRGEGVSFCSGADISWFAESVKREKSESWQEYLKFAELLKRISFLSKITIAAVHKNVKGGGNGLAAACDFIIAEESTSFAFSEIKLGIIPSTILPFVGKRVSMQNLKKLMYSGEVFRAPEARLIGLVDFVAEEEKLEQLTDKLVEELSVMPFEALKECKKLIMKIDSGEVGIENCEFTAGVLADLVYSKEGQEGLRAFLEKRKPNWVL